MSTTATNGTTNEAVMRLLSLLHNVRKTGDGWSARCPAHEDDNNSLSISIGDNKGAVLYCHAGCANADVVAAVGLELSDLFAPDSNGNGHSNGRAARKLLESYPYCDENGVVLYNVCRYEPKGFSQRRPKEGGGWIWSLGNLRRVLYRLPELRAAIEADPSHSPIVFVVEGEKDVGRLRSLGLTAVCNSGGGTKAKNGESKWLPTYSDSLRGCRVIVIPDADEAGRAHAAAAARMTHGKAASVKIVELGLTAKGADVSDWLAAGGTCEQLMALAAAAPEWEPSADDGRDEAGASPQQIDPADPRRRINAGCKDLQIITADALAALRAANEPAALFRYGGVPSRIELDDEEQLIVHELDFHRMRHHLARAALWLERKGKGEEAYFAALVPPKDVVNDVLATPNIDLPILVRVVEAPVFAADGNLQTTPGYHQRSKTYYVPAAGFSVPDVPEQPTGQDIESARELICTELLGDFPFVGDAELAHAVALLLLPFARDLINGPTPLHLIEKPSPGTGASLLVDALAWPAIGRSIATMTEGRDEDEWRKRLTAKLRTGSAFIMIDNLRRRLDSAAFSAGITSTTWEDRLVGFSEMARTPVRCVWVATGNNPAVSTEIARRVIRIRMDAKQDRPWLRTGFRHENLRAWVAENRGLLVWAALTLIRAWHQSERPTGGIVLGMFEQWAKTIGGILEIAGIKGFLSNLADFYDQSDAEGNTWRAFLAAWWERFANNEAKVRDLHAVAIDACVPMGDGGEQSQRIVLGKMLGDRRDRVFDMQFDDESCRLKVERGEQKQRAYTWKLQKTEK